MQDYFKYYIKAVKKPLPEMVRYFRQENNYLKKIVNKKNVVLDVGCGNGRTMKFLAPYVNKIYGIDYNPNMIKEAKRELREYSNTILIENNFLKYHFTNNFDLVYASYNLLGSCETSGIQSKRILKKMINITKNNGHVIVSVWGDKGIEFARKYYSSIGIKVLSIKNNNVITNFGTFRRFPKEKLEKMGKSVNKNYKITDLAGIFYLLDIIV